VKRTIILLLVGSAIGLFVFSFLSPTRSDQRKESYRVIRVFDGDTIEIEGGKRIRYIGIDTPEIKNDKGAVECFAQQARDKNRELVEGKMVTLLKDVSETDDYGRLLRYVFIEDIFVNEVLVKEGYAKSTPIAPDIAYRNQLFESQKTAQTRKRGLWISC